MKIIQKKLAGFLAFTPALFALCTFCVRLDAETNLNFPPFKYLSFGSSANFTLPKDSEKENALASSAGFQIEFDGLDLRFYRSLPKTEFSEISDCGTWSERFDLLDDFRYGGAISLYQKSTPVIFKLGMNSYSKSISRLKNPAPSASANALKKSLGFSSGIGINLPNLNSSVKPRSAAVSVSLPFSKKIGLDFQGFLTEENESGISAQSEIVFSRIAFLEISATLARFYIENNASVLKKNNCGFEADFFYAGSVEASFKSPFFKSNFYCGIHENPFKDNEYKDFDDFNFWLKTENRFAFKNLLFDFSYFAIPSVKNSPKAAPLVSGSSSICRTIEQWTLNPQILIPLNEKKLSSLRFGLCFVESWKITSGALAESFCSSKVKGGILFENRFSAVKGEYSIENLILGGEPGETSSVPDKFQEAKISVSSRNSLFSISYSASCKFYFDDEIFSSDKQNYTLSLSVSPKSKILTSSSSLSVTRKDRGEKTETSGTFLSSGTVKFKTKSNKIRTSCKIGLSVPF